MGTLAKPPSLPVHVEDNPCGPRYGSQNAIYCRECYHRFGGAYGAISAGAHEWRFCPYCGIEIVPTNPYHQPTEATWRGEGEWRNGLPPETWGDTIEGKGRGQNRNLPEPPHELPAPDDSRN